MKMNSLEVKVLSAVGMRQVMLNLGPKFERATGHTLTVTFGSGAGIAERVESGETTDIVMIPRAAHVGSRYRSRRAVSWGPSGNVPLFGRRHDWRQGA